MHQIAIFTTTPRSRHHVLFIHFKETLSIQIEAKSSLPCLPLDFSIPCVLISNASFHYLFGCIVEL